jgi:predicted nucleic acid-binding protein
MIIAPLRVVLDANVLYPFTLRDTLLRAAAAGLYQARWSVRILDEATDSLIAAGHMTREQAAHLRQAMSAAFEDAMITGYEALIPSMGNHEKDRHVTAAAVKAGAGVIVTVNLVDFRILPEGIEAQSPDDFLSELFELDPHTMIALVRAQARDLRRPPRSFEEILAALANMVPQFADAVRRAL